MIRTASHTVVIALVLLAATAGVIPAREAPSPSVSIEEIAVAIEGHITKRVEEDGGYYRLQHDGRELALKLVRVHMEYLADLGGGVQFACVDLADLSGDVYDVDFFLTGGPGAMTVTETTVHKRNGIPYYAWTQREDQTWHRISVEAASPRDLGVITEADTFEFRYHAELPVIAARARMWLPLPVSDRWQTVEVVSVEAPGKRDTLRDRDYGNRVLFLELGPEDSESSLDLLFRVERRETVVHASDMTDPARYLRPLRSVPEDERFDRIAEQVIAGKTTELVQARSLYDHVIDNMRYMKHGEYGTGDAVYACDIGTGNCTEYHSYFMALSRSAGLPSRFAIGVAIPSERNEGKIDGYHCWAEFFADGKWWPIDISEGDKYSSLATYYFGHHPANRFQLSRGRDLVIEPGPASGPIDFLAYPVLEIDGEPATTDVTFSFRRLTAPRP